MMGSRDDKKRSALRETKPVTPFWYFLADWILRPSLNSLFRLRTRNLGIIPKKGAAILVANHVNFFDPIWIYISLDRALHFVATEELFRKRFLGLLVRGFGTIPFRRGGTDFQAIRNIVTLLKAGGLIGIYPEGVRSWDGTNSPIIPTIARIIRMSRVPVFYCQQEGSYLNFPRWADKWRPVRVLLKFGRLYTPETIPSNDEQVIADIARVIRTPDYELKVPKPKRRVSGMALGLQKLIYRCPNCRSVESLKAVAPLSSNRAECQSCFASWEVDLGSRMTPVDDEGRAIAESKTVAEVYRQVREMPLKAIRSNLIELDRGEKLYLVSRPHLLYREKQYPYLRIFGYGRAFLTDRRFTFRGRLRSGRSRRLVIPLESIDGITVEPGDKLHFSYNKVLYRIQIRGESAVKWFDALRRLTAARKTASASA
jgi:1-acyl-sn-glycerol-3-phosphate acyltransferase